MKKSISMMVAVCIMCLSLLGVGTACADTVNGKVTLAQVHQRLQNDGWELQSVNSVMLSDAVFAQVASTLGTSDIVIEDIRATESFYTQPIKQRSTYNNALLDGVTNYSRVISTVIAAGMPVAKWIPSAVGFVSREIVELSARELAHFTLTQTLYVYCIEVKRADWPAYYVCVESDKLTATARAMFSGYNPDGSQCGGHMTGSNSWQSPHYQDYEYLSAKALEIALNDGYVWMETYDDSSGITLVRID